VTFRFRCSACNTPLSAPESMAAASVRCPTCSTVLEVPAAPESKDQAVAAPAEHESVAEQMPVRFGTARRTADDDMDMTPMVDVTFLLLIFFMITASFAMQKSFEIPAPDSDEPSTQQRTLEDFEEDPEYVVVRVDSFNTYHVLTSTWDEEQEAPSKQELLIKLREACQSGSVRPTRMLVVANGEAMHEKVVTAQDAGMEMEMQEVKLVTVEEDD